MRFTSISMKNYTLICGLILGFLGVAITGITYGMGIQAMISLWTTLMVFLLFTGLYLYFGFRFRKMNGGYLIFKEAFALLFFISVISSVISGLFMIVLYHAINPALPGQLQDAAIQKYIGWMQRFEVPKAQIDEQVARMQLDPSQYTVGNQLRGIAISFIWSAAVAAVLGLIVKRNPPPTLENTLDQPE